MATNDRNRNSDKTFLINKLKKKKVNELRELCEIFEEGNGRMRKKECVEILTSILLNIYFGYKGKISSDCELFFNNSKKYFHTQKTDSACML